MIGRSLYLKCPKPVSAVNVYVTLSSTEETYVARSPRRRSVPASSRCILPQ